MAKIDLSPDEKVLQEGWGAMLQGGRVKFLVQSRFMLTNRRFLYYDLGGWAAVWVTLGFLLRFLIKGRLRSMDLEGLTATRGKYAANRSILRLSQDGEEVLLHGFERWRDLFQAVLVTQPDLHMEQVEAEEWVVRRL